VAAEHHHEGSAPVPVNPERWVSAVQAAWRTAGHRMTEPRSQVLRYIASYSTPFSAEQLYAALQQDQLSPGRATVYRALEQLSHEGWIVRIHVGGNNDSTYSVSWPGHIHHLVCTSCGHVVAFAGCALETLLTQLSQQTGFQIEGHLLEVYGLCAACGQQAR
jgi:Fur family ferric uptake transcriptional regulator